MKKKIKRHPEESQTQTQSQTEIQTENRQKCEKLRSSTSYIASIEVE